MNQVGSQGNLEGTLLSRYIHFCLTNRIVVFIAVLFLLGSGIMFSPFNWQTPFLPSNPIAVDAIPDYGENQQVVFTTWKGQSPQDIEDQITYPLTSQLLGLPGVKTVRSQSMIGFSSIYVIFEDDIEFYFSRTRLLEKLNALPAGTLPDGVKPTLGPDATALGQVFWYTLEGRDENGDAAGGWDLGELRTIQDWTVKNALLSAGGVSEVASVGGFVQEYQIDVDPDAMHAHDVTIDDVFKAVKNSNRDVSARTIEVNKVEYILRGLGFIKSIKDLDYAVIKSNDNVPVYVKDIAHVTLGPALRRGMLDKAGTEAVGAVVVARFGENPLMVIDGIKEKIKEISSSLPQKELADGRVSKVTIVPFYDRSALIQETLGTLESALTEEVLITVIVVLLMLMHLRSSLLITMLLPISVCICFILMKIFKIEANIVALSGIAIAIGTMVDMGIIICENIVRHINKADVGARRLDVIYRATCEVSGPIITSVATTVVSFLPVFTLEAAEGKLFGPLAFTKTFSIIAAVFVALSIIPPFASLLFRKYSGKQRQTKLPKWSLYLFALCFTFILAQTWLPLGPENGILLNGLFVVGIVGGCLGLFALFHSFYALLLNWCLKHKGLFMILPVAICGFGIYIWVGLGNEFMPKFNEGAFLYMPTTGTHASIGEVTDVLSKQDRAIDHIYEVEMVVGKLGRVNSALDPAPVSMIETVINYYPKFKVNNKGRRQAFAYDREKVDYFCDPLGHKVNAPDGKPYKVRGAFVRDDKGALIPKSYGQPFRLWRPPLDPVLNPDRVAFGGINTAQDIWDQITIAAKMSGTTSAPLLQPIETRLIMMQTGTRAPMAIKLKGPTLEAIETFGLQIEKILKKIPSVDASSVFADRIVGKPYLEIDIDRKAIARYGIQLDKVQQTIEVAIGGKQITTTVEGRKRFPVRIRYMRELRNTIESLDRILVSTPEGVHIPLGQMATINYRPGPQMIKSENTFLTGYVLYNKQGDIDEGAAVEAVGRVINQHEKDGLLKNPDGVVIEYTGNYENQIRANARLALIIPAACLIIFVILYLQFKTISTALLVFCGIAVAWAGGFIMLWLYGQDWFLNFHFLGIDVRDLFQIQPIHLSVAVWVGFLALFGIASDDGVMMASYLSQQFKGHHYTTKADIRAAVLRAGLRRIRPCLMTTATTLLALIPILTSQGKGADIMIPMAIPAFGGMLIALITLFVVPVLYCWVAERNRS